MRTPLPPPSIQRVVQLFRIGLLLGVLLAPLTAAAQLSFPPITNRNFNIDLFEQPALGSPRLIAMSGAIDAVAVALSFAGDVAARYKNLGVSIGFWN